MAGLLETEGYNKGKNLIENNLNVMEKENEEKL